MIRIKNEKGLFENEYSNLNDKEWLINQYITLKKTTTQIAEELGCVVSTVYFALVRLDIPKRSRSEARIGIKFSDTHMENLTKANQAKALSGSSHPNWQGGKSTENDKRMAALKRDPRYKAWAKAVKSVGFCKSCGSTQELHAHHILPKSTHPHLIHDISNGMCLCKDCHTALHLNDNRMNSGNPKNPEPSRV